MLLLVAVMLAGMVIGNLTVGIANWRHRLARESLAKDEQAESKERPIVNGSKDFLPDGAIHLSLNEPGYWSSQTTDTSNRKKDIYNRDGDLIWSGKQADVPFTYLKWSQSWQSGRYQIERDGIGRNLMQSVFGIRPEFSRGLVIPVVLPRGDEQQVTERWRYDPIADIFTGYDAKGKMIGYIGSNGFAASRQQVEAFGEFESMTVWSPTASDSPFLVWRTFDRLYQIDFQRRSTEVLLDVPGDRIMSVAFNKWHVSEAYQGPYRPAICVTTEAVRHYLLMRRPKQLLELNLPEHFRETDSSMSMCVYENKIFLKNTGTQGRPSRDDIEAFEKWMEDFNRKPRRYWANLYQLSADAAPELVTEFKWTRPPRQGNDAVWKADKEYKAFTERIWSNATATSPSLYDLLWRWYYKGYRRFRADSSFNGAVAEILHFTHPRNLGANLFVTMIMGCLAAWHGWARRTGWVRFALWLVFVAAFNVAGLMTYLALNHTVLIRCANCGKRRGLERADCPACNAQLPKPVPREVDLILPQPA